MIICQNGCKLAWDDLRRPIWWYVKVDVNWPQMTLWSWCHVVQNQILASWVLDSCSSGAFMIINSKSWQHFFFQSFKTRAFTIKKWFSHLINKSDLETNSQQSKYFKGLFDLIFFSIQLRKRLLCQICSVIHASKERFEKFLHVSLLYTNRDEIKQLLTSVHFTNSISLHLFLYLC